MNLGYDSTTHLMHLTVIWTTFERCMKKMELESNVVISLAHVALGHFGKPWLASLLFNETLHRVMHVLSDCSNIMKLCYCINNSLHFFFQPVAYFM